MSGVVCDRIGKSFGETQVLSDVCLEIADGEFLTLLGPSGCGKSTLLRILAGLEVQTSGSVAIGGRVVDGVHPKSRDVAMVFQSYALYPHMTVHQNMSVPLRMRRLSPWQRLPLLGRFVAGTSTALGEIERDIMRTAGALGIGHLMARKPGQLSGGQRQRVAVGRAMVRRPAVFLMDEPLSNLDAKLRVQMRAEIKALHRRLGITFIYVTHDQSEAMTLSDRVAVMMDGRLLQVAPPQVLYAAPVDVNVAAFIGSPRINLIEGVVRGDGAVSVLGAVLPLKVNQAPGSKVTIGLRPENLILADEKGVDRPASSTDATTGQLSGVVQELEHLGSDLFIHLAMDGAADPVIARIDPRAHSRLAHGTRVALAAAHGAIVLFDARGQRIAAPYANGHDQVMVDAQGLGPGSDQAAKPIGNGQAMRALNAAIPPFVATADQPS